MKTILNLIILSGCVWIGYKLPTMLGLFPAPEVSDEIMKSIFYYLDANFMFLAFLIARDGLIDKKEYETWRDWVEHVVSVLLLYLVLGVGNYYFIY